MSKRKTILAISVIAVATIVSVAVVSCKKEDIKPSSNNQGVLSKEVFNPKQIEDMNAYLKGFKQKMQESKGEESMNLEEAAWHLSSVANYDFANANVECDDIRFDTLYDWVTVTNGEILLSDLASAYERISTAIDKFYNGLVLDNKNFRFIGVNISGSGEVELSLITTFNTGSKYIFDTCYYFADDNLAWQACYEYFDEYYDYPVQTLGTSELKRVLNLIENHSNPSALERYYYTTTWSKVFRFNEYIDIYESPSHLNSRLYANTGYFSYFDIKPYICYYFDSYLGLGFQYLLTDEYIISWGLDLITDIVHGSNLWVQRHELTLNYGERHSIDPGPGSGPND